MLPKKNRLLKNYQFRYVYKHGTSVPSKHLVLVFTSSRPPTVSRFGFSVSNKVGSAVLRNYVRRVFRESVRALLPEIKGGFNCIVAASNKFDFTSTDFSELNASVRYVFKKAGLLKN
jgi:ribonuclease P protein component